MKFRVWVGKGKGGKFSFCGQYLKEKIVLKNENDKKSDIFLLVLWNRERIAMKIFIFLECQILP